MIEDRYFSVRSSYIVCDTLSRSFSLFLSLCFSMPLCCRSSRVFLPPSCLVSLSRSAVITSFYLLSSPPLVSALQLSFSLMILLFLFASCQLSLRITLLLSRFPFYFSLLLCFLLFFCHLLLSIFFADIPIFFSSAFLY